MSRSIHFISKGIPGYGVPDRYIPCSGVSGRAVNISPSASLGDNKPISDVKFLSLRSAYRYTSSVCNASSGKYRRNPDFSRQNRHGFSRNRNNRHNEEKDGYKDSEESEIHTSKNGSILSLSGNPKFQATSKPGAREKEIVELFRKVQAQLRERSAMKEERKDDDTQGKRKESETVDSLLKLLRKHSIQGKKSTSSASNRDFVLDQPERAPPAEERSTGISNSNSSVKHETQESPRSHLNRPKSNFRKRSPVPEIKFPPVYSEDSVNSIPQDDLDVGREGINLERDAEGIHVVVESDTESDVEAPLLEGNIFDSETSGRCEDDMVEEQNPVEAINLSLMKMTELRALAKSRGMRGFSKLKKSELIELLNQGPI